MIYPSNATHMFAPRTIEIMEVLLLPLFFLSNAQSLSEDEYCIKLGMKITINSNENQTITRKSLYAAPHTNHLINIGRLNSNLLFMQIYGRITRIQLRKPTSIPNQQINVFSDALEVFFAFPPSKTY